MSSELKVDGFPLKIIKSSQREHKFNTTSAVSGGGHKPQSAVRNVTGGLQRRIEASKKLPDGSDETVRLIFLYKLLFQHTSLFQGIFAHL